MKKHKIYFRADASAEIGYGHFIRTLALADMLKDDFNCTFFTQTPSAYQIKEIQKVCKYVPLPSDNSKFELFLDILSGDEIVVLDNYFYSTDYQRQIKTKGCKLVCVDDMHDKHYVADIVINHGVEDKNVFSIESYTQLCLGLNWALLRKPFLEISPTDVSIEKKKNTWLIAFGGSDANNLTEKYINLLVRDCNTVIYTVIGDAYKYKEHLKLYQNVKVLSNLSAMEMATIMRLCENAIVPSSSICIEALSQGCNVYTGYYVDNQKEFYENISSRIHKLGNLLTYNTPISYKEKISEYKFNGIQIKDNFRKVIWSLIP